MSKLLVVDDEKNLRLVVQKELSRQGHEVVTAEDGEMAWEELFKQDFDVIIVRYKYAASGRHRTSSPSARKIVESAGSDYADRTGNRRIGNRSDETRRV